jgi:cell division septation protein DedD
VDPGAGDAAFYVRVATFRNASNARRLAASLGEREPGVVLESLPAGLQAVVLGPFSARPMAAAAAEGIDQETGLASQVVVRLFP